MHPCSISWTMIIMIPQRAKRGFPNGPYIIDPKTLIRYRVLTIWYQSGFVYLTSHTLRDLIEHPIVMSWCLQPQRPCLQASRLLQKPRRSPERASWRPMQPLFPPLGAWAMNQGIPGITKWPHQWHATKLRMATNISQTFACLGTMFASWCWVLMCFRYFRRLEMISACSGDLIFYREKRRDKSSPPFEMVLLKHMFTISNRTGIKAFYIA